MLQTIFLQNSTKSTLEFLCHKNPQQPEHIRFEEAWDVMGCFPLPCQHYSSVALLCLDARCLGFFACGRTMLQIESTSNGLTNIHQHVLLCCFRLGRICSVFLSHISSFFTDYMEQASSTPIPDVLRNTLCVLSKRAWQRNHLQEAVITHLAFGFTVIKPTFKQHLPTWSQLHPQIPGETPVKDVQIVKPF